LPRNELYMHVSSQGEELMFKKLDKEARRVIEKIAFEEEHRKAIEEDLRRMFVERRP